MAESNHTPVLLTEMIEALALREDSVVLDATFGGGGHSSAIARELSNKGTLIALDADAQALATGRKALADVECTLHLVHENFRNIHSVLTHTGIDDLDGVIADLGWRTDQVLHAEGDNRKGFSFQRDEPLLMTYGDPDDYAFTARDIVNEWKEEDIANVLFGYGEERFARRIARKIVEARGEQAIETTHALVEVIERSVPAFYRRKKVHPATKSFQALRIAVNDELAALEEFIEQAVAHLRPDGVLAIITFHSIEDRIVKRYFRQFAHDHVGTRITKKPITPSTEEIKRNPRARSAKLRIFKRTGSSQNDHEDIHKNNTIRT